MVKALQCDWTGKLDLRESKQLPRPRKWHCHMLQAVPATSHNLSSIPPFIYTNMCIFQNKKKAGFNNTIKIPSIPS